MVERDRLLEEGKAPVDSRELELTVGEGRYAQPDGVEVLRNHHRQSTAGRRAAGVLGGHCGRRPGGDVGHCYDLGVRRRPGGHRGQAGT